MILSLLALLLLAIQASSIKIDYEIATDFKRNLLLSQGNEMKAALELFLDAAGFEDIFEDYSRQVVGIYDQHLTRAIQKI